MASKTVFIHAGDSSLLLTHGGELDQLHHGAVLGDVQEGDLALVLPLVGGPHLGQAEAGGLDGVVQQQLRPVEAKRKAKHFKVAQKKLPNKWVKNLTNFREVCSH